MPNVPTRKDYRIIAHALNEVHQRPPPHTLEEITETLADHMSAAYPNFSREKFVDVVFAPTSCDVAVPSTTN